MVWTCVYCGNKPQSRERTFHKFPLNNAIQLNAWLKNMGLAEKFVLTKYKRLCSDHFEKTCFQKGTNNAILLQGSVPRLFGTYKTACAYCNAMKSPDNLRSFHCFPLKNTALLYKWLSNAGFKNFFPEKYSLLCSDHFEPNCFRKGKHGKLTWLKQDAIPTKFTPVKSEEEVPSRTHYVCPEEESTDFEKEIWTLNSAGVSDTKHSMNDAKNEPQIPSPLSEDPLLEALPPTHDTETDQKPSYLSSSSSAHLSCYKCFTGDAESSFELMVTSDEAFPPLSASSDEHNKDSQKSITISTWQLGTPDTKRHIQSVNVDHHEERSPRSMRKKLDWTRKKIAKQQQEIRVHRQKMKRLQKRISTLKAVVSDLHRTKAIPESSLSYLDSIADTDISE